MRAAEFINESVDPYDISKEVQEIHRDLNDFEEGDINDRIYWFDAYDLTTIPVTKLKLTQWIVDEDLVEEYMDYIKNSPDTMPPIVYDPVANSIIDGTHRANAYARLGYKTIPAYVGKVKSASYGEREELEEAMPKWAKGALGATALAGVGLMSLPTHKNSTPTAQITKSVKQQTTQLPKQDNIHNKELQVLAQTIWSEARGYGRDGMEAVGSVILNRANDTENAKFFGKGILGVALKPKQFSCWNKGDPNMKRAEEMKKIAQLIKTRTSPTGEPFDKWVQKFKQTGDYLDYKKWRLAFQVASDLLQNRVSDPTGGATFYHTKAVRPSWAKMMKKLKAIDSHVFYDLPERT